MVSDFQAAGWDADVGETASLRLPRGLVVTPVRVSETDSAYNVTVGGAEIVRSTVAERERVTVTARLTVNGTPPASIPVRLEVDGRQVEGGTASFGEGNSANVTFAPLTLPERGSTRGTIRIDSDNLKADDALNFTLSSDQRMGVLIVNGPGVGEGSSYFLERALSIGNAPGFRVEVRRTGQLTAADIAANPVIIMHQSGIPSGDIGDRLKSHVERGGGLIMLTGENALGDWPGVLPSVPGPVDRRNSGGTNVGYVDTGHPVFEAFAGPRTGDFGGARIYRYRPLPSSSFPRILARFGDGGVALAERPVEAGRLLVWSSTLDGSWNDLALQPIFLPFLHQLVKYAAGYNPGRSWLMVGDPFDLRSLGPAAEGFDVTLTPSGERIELAGETEIQLKEVGFYEMRSSGSTERDDAGRKRRSHRGRTDCVRPGRDADDASGRYRNGRKQPGRIGDDPGRARATAEGMVVRRCSGIRSTCCGVEVLQSSLASQSFRCQSSRVCAVGRPEQRSGQRGIAVC